MAFRVKSALRLPSLLQRTAAVALFGGACVLGLQAQQAPNAAASNSSHTAFSNAHPLDLRLPTEAAYSSSAVSSSAAASESIAAERLSFAGTSMQPPPRRRYGRPRYNDSMHNSDGSNKLAFIAGAGLTVPIGSDTSNYLKPSYSFQVGVGRNFNKRLAVLAQFDFDHFGLPGNVITTQQNLYNSLNFVQQNQNGTTSPVSFSNLGGGTRIWSFTLDPTYNFYQSDTLGAYVIGGGGFYHKVTDFTLPTTGVAYDYLYGPYQYTTNQSFDHYTSNSPGVNGGVGVTYKFSRFANEKLFAEVRYVHTFNSARPYAPASYNYYPANANTSSYLPITVGVRF